MKINKLFFASLAILATLVGCKEKEEAPLAPFLNLDKTEVELGKEGGSATVTLTTNRDWTATPSAEWITVEPESGSASDDAQSVTITVLPNTGNNRPGSVSFSIGLAKKSVSVSQLGEGGSLEDATVYKNDFDKEEATKTYGKSSSSWPYLDQFEGWKNAAGSGVGSETYDFSGMSARANSSSNGSYSDYNGSGKNNLFFGSNAYFAIHGIVLPENTNYTLNFGSEKYTQDGSSLFVHSEFHVYISNDGAKWVELEYAFPNGDKEGTWDLASTTFTVPAGTSSLSIYVGADVASVYRIDDLSLMVSSAAGTEIDFSKGTAIGGGTEGGDEGGSEGGETPGPEDPIIGDSLSVVVKNCTWSAETDPTYGVGFSATISGVKIGYYKYNSTTDLKAPAPDQMRIYKKAALCITAPNGKKVTSVAITTSEKANGNDYNVPLETVVGGGSSVVTSTTSQIWTPSEPAQTIVATSSNGQVRALSFVITLAE